MSARLFKGEIVEGGIGPYAIEDFHSMGHFAVSYKARGPNGERVFLKQYKSPSRMVPWYRAYIDYQRELKRRVESDPTLASRTYDFVDMFEAGGAFIQAFGFIERGRDLRHLLDSGKATPRQRWQFAESFVSALARFHGAGIVHTDLKPENVFLMPGALGSGWNVKIIDFDFTVLSGRSIPWLGKMGWVGTTRYMSPEHIRGKVPDAKSDVFTTALILYEMLAQGHPYPEDDDEYRDAAIAGKPPKPLFGDENHDGAELAAALMGALSPEPDNRPNAEDLLAALRKSRSAFGSISSPVMPKADCESAPTPSEPVPPGAVRLSGAGGSSTFRLDAVFGRKTMTPIIGDEDSRFLEGEQFRLSKTAGSGQWRISAPEDVKNPPMLDGIVVGSTPVTVKNGSVLFAATSRKNRDIRKGRVDIALG